MTNEVVETQATCEENVPARHFTKEDLEKMLPEYMRIMDQDDNEEAGLAWLKDNFSDKPRDILAFAGMVADVVYARNKDKAPSAIDEGTDDVSGDEGSTEGSDAGQTDPVEQA